MTTELKFAEGIGKPEVTRDVKVKLVSDIVGNPEDDGEGIVEFADGYGAAEGRYVLVQFADGNGVAEGGRNVLVELADAVGRPEIGREEMVELAEELGNPEEAGGEPELAR